MTNEPDRLSVKLASAKGGALLWIALRADRGRLVTRDDFLREFSGYPWDAEYGRDLLDELHRAGLIEEEPDGGLAITRHALEWIDAADFWRWIADAF